MWQKHGTSSNTALSANRLTQMIGALGNENGRGLKLGVGNSGKGLLNSCMLWRVVQGLGFQESYTLPNSNLHNYYPKPKYLIIGSFGPLGSLQGPRFL